MKRFLVMLMVALFSAVLIAPDADARRMGGGRSFGKQSDFTKRDAARPPTQSGQQSAAPPASGAAAAAGAAGKRSWLGPIAGIAAGLGLAALASHLGLGEEFGTMILMALVVFAVLIAVRMFMARRNGGAGGRGSGTAYAGAGAGSGGSTGGLRIPAKADSPWAARTSSGGASGASAGGAGGAGTAWPAAAGAGAVAAETSHVPADFDSERFIHGAKLYFVRLQAAFDNNKAEDLREFTSPEMFAELSQDLMKRGNEKQTTDVVTLDARLLGVEHVGGDELASVRFDGMLRETSDGAAAPFAEVWNFTRPINRSAGWVLAGIQQVD